MLNRQLKWVLIIIAIGSILAIISYKTEFLNTCTVRQMTIAGEIKQYDETKDPLICDKLNTKISQFNNQCKSNVEELDCG
ncbi:MAG: hypothetical protein KGI28_06300 [Thaumarchaeota archaeon]|nr:hypothetical protein [Nitrososphaerota archaeon]